MRRTRLQIAGLLGGAVAALLLCAAPASAQTQSAAGDMGSGGGMMPGINLGGGDKQTDPAVAEKRREIEDAYKRATHDNPPQQQAVNDPWANMRGADEQKPAVVKHAAKPIVKKKPAQ